MWELTSSRLDFPSRTSSTYRLWLLYHLHAVSSGLTTVQSTQYLTCTCSLFWFDYSTVNTVPYLYSLHTVSSGLTTGQSTEHLTCMIYIQSRWTVNRAPYLYDLHTIPLGSQQGTLPVWFTYSLFWFDHRTINTVPYLYDLHTIPFGLTTGQSIEYLTCMIYIQSLLVWP